MLKIQKYIVLFEQPEKQNISPQNNSKDRMLAQKEVPPVEEIRASVIAGTKRELEISLESFLSEKGNENKKEKLDTINKGIREAYEKKDQKKIFELNSEKQRFLQYCYIASGKGFDENTKTQIQSIL
jgi:hypothetical protein